MGKGVEQIFLQRRHTNGQQDMKRCWTTLTIGEVQIKMTLRYHFTPMRMAIIKKKKDNECWWGMWRNWNPCTLLVRIQYCATAMENSMEIPQKN